MKEGVTKVEILSCTSSVVKNIPQRTAAEAVEVFRLMFPNDPIAAAEERN
jgi:hypothetical protein